MKILQTPARFYPYVGGVEKYVLTISRELVKKGHSVTVICANEPKGKIIDNYEGIGIKRLLSIFKIANTNITPGLSVGLLKDRFDIIHTHIPTPWSADCSSIVSVMKKGPLVVTYHNDIGGKGIYRLIASFYNRTLLRFVLKRATCIIITSSGFRSPHIARYRDKVVSIPNSVDTDFFKPISRPIKGDILFIGVLDTYHQYKGLDVLFAAVREISKELPDIRLIVGGSGPMKEYYVGLSRSTGISGNVEFAGYIPDNKLRDYYNSCRMVVLPSIDPTREGFGIVLLEAMACGRPVVSSDITGVADDIRIYGAGLVIEPQNAFALAEAIKTILNDPDLANKMGLAGRELVGKKYGSGIVAEQVEEVYRNAILQQERKP